MRVLNSWLCLLLSIWRLDRIRVGWNDMSLNKWFLRSFLQKKSFCIVNWTHLKPWIGKFLLLHQNLNIEVDMHNCMTDHFKNQFLNHKNIRKKITFFLRQMVSNVLKYLVFINHFFKNLVCISFSKVWHFSGNAKSKQMYGVSTLKFIYQIINPFGYFQECEIMTRKFFYLLVIKVLMMY